MSDLPGIEGDGDLDQEALGQRLRQIREYLGLSQQYVTSATGIPRSAVSEIERGNRKVDSLELRKLARAYQTSVGRLLGDVEESAGAFSALERAMVDLTPQDQDEVLRFAEFLTHRRSREPGEVT
ncbi:helix-turn-helix domain-containing protein [Jiangella asiatica]|uniref:XRE family transcriptional regulator n=1 Tax=Jiangella asiatica TaxID=2530372 RepID=A0A4R5D9B1_9ACTN|nr:helix-turn-helix transcriptional regulator [Jiangella asiatica]TDE08490.1 XRE family transcriptional regulator [Jiangella asiatica]